MKSLILKTAAALVAASALVQDAGAAQGDANFVTVNGNITTNTRWTRDNVYILTRMIFVHNGAVLTIEPGTIIRGVQKGAAGSDLNNEPGALVISRTGKIIANGTADAPIIMTGIDDYNVPGGLETVPVSYVNSQGNSKNVPNPMASSPGLYDPDGGFGANGFAWVERWGGLVLLGQAHVAQGATGTVDNGNGVSTTVASVFADDAVATNDAAMVGADIIEGIDPAFVPDTAGPATNKLGVYGGLNDSDNSGVLRFVSVRYGGNPIGNGNELNSVTMGGVGDSTVVEHVEATFNTDDGFEWFGGRVNTRFLFSLYNLDDSFDADEGFRTTSQFWTALQGNEIDGRSNFANNNGIPSGQGSNQSTLPGNGVNQLMEIDGPEPNNGGNLPNTIVNLYNFTYLGAGNIGDGAEDAIRFRISAQGNLFNGIAEMHAGATSESVISSATPHVTNVTNLHYASPFTLATGGGSSQATSATDVVSEASSQVVSKLPYNQNDGASNLGYDYRLLPAAGARTEDGPLPPGGMVQVNYAGSARDCNQLMGWSNLSYLGVLPTVTHPTRLSITLGMATNPTVSFSFSGRGAGTIDYPAGTKFVVERSTDERTWVPVTVVVDGDSSDTDAAAGSITVEDSAALGSSAVYYRAYAL